MHATYPLLRATDFPPVRRRKLETLQVNLGYKCNQSCQHCHVNAGPNRTEMMDGETVDLVIEVLRARKLTTLDLTGGAPELNVHFRRLVEAARVMGVQVIDRCNLTILFEPGQEDLAQFLADQDVDVTASMPCYSQENVDQQRGDGVFDKSISALQKLNALGYGTERQLNLVYNPLGAQLPPQQNALEADFKRELAKHYDISFSQLFTLANMPIQRFGSVLVSKGKFESYMQLLKDNFNSANMESLMCRNTISVDHLGNLYDCDFNQMLGMMMKTGGGGRAHLRDLLADPLESQPVMVANHCYGCTAGQGSSCGGALASNTKGEAA